MNKFLAEIARKMAHGKGQTVELPLDGEAYTGTHVDRILYGTPENAGAPITIAVSETPGMMTVYTTPEGKERAERIIAAIESGK